MSVTAPTGFRAGGVASGIKPGGLLDLALVAADRPVPAAGVFTRNRAAAPPVLLSRRRVQAGAAQAVLLNSGCANAGTGAAGWAAAEATSAALAETLRCPPQQVLVCSTGPIGDPLPAQRVIDALPTLVAAADPSPRGGLDAARAIMTTDTHPKQARVEGDGYLLGGMAKGAGMLRPDMATMLAVLTTDATVDAATLGKVLTEAVAVTFNCLDVDGCESTNDTVLLLASGEAAPPGDLDSFGSAVERLCRELAAQLAADAEGTSRVVTLRVRGAASRDAARALGRQVADSALVRSAFYGADPNWGRILGALGAAGVELDPSRVRIAYQGVVVCDGGVRHPHDVEAVAALMQGDFTVDIEVGSGPGEVEILTTDLTPDYVRFNGERS